MVSKFFEPRTIFLKKYQNLPESFAPTKSRRKHLITIDLSFFFWKIRIIKSNKSFAFGDPSSNFCKTSFKIENIPNCDDIENTSSFERFYGVQTRKSSSRFDRRGSEFREKTSKTWLSHQGFFLEHE